MQMFLVFYTAWSGIISKTFQVFHLPEAACPSRVFLPKLTTIMSLYEWNLSFLRRGRKIFLPNIKKALRLKETSLIASHDGTRCCVLCGENNENLGCWFSVILCAFIWRILELQKSTRIKYIFLISSNKQKSLKLFYHNLKKITWGGVQHVK